jgi:rRNA maturation RNase YbeY
MSVYFHNEDNSYVLLEKKPIKRWLNEVVMFHEKTLGTINIIFCSDNYLLAINREHLKHNYYTDIITFSFCENNTLSGDLFISIERIKDYSKNNNLFFVNELHRVIVHGVLHLCGFNDKTEKEKEKMRQLEDRFLKLLKKQ